MSKIHLLKENSNIFKKDMTMCGKAVTEKIIFETDIKMLYTWSERVICSRCIGGLKLNNNVK